MMLSLYPKLFLDKFFFSNAWGNHNLKENLAIVSFLLEAKKLYMHIHIYVIEKLST